MMLALPLPYHVDDSHSAQLVSYESPFPPECKSALQVSLSDQVLALGLVLPRYSGVHMDVS